MVRGLVIGVGIHRTAAEDFTGNCGIALSMLIVFVCVTAVVSLCAGFARHRVLHRESETDGEKMELRSVGHGLSSSCDLQIKRNSFKKSPSRTLSRLQGNQDLEDTNNDTPLAIWQKVILRGERCVPLSFSGLVLYDEKGNMLPGRCNFNAGYTEEFND